MINSTQKLNPKLFDEAVEQVPIRKGFGEGLLKAAPGAFTVLGLDAAFTFRLRGSGERGGKQFLDLGLSVQNLTNARYREYLNFFRFFADEPGVNLGIRAKWRF